MVTCDGKPRAWLPTVEGDGGGGGDGGSCCGGGSCRGGGSGWGSSSSGGGGGGRVVGNNGGCCNGSMVGADTVSTPGNGRRRLREEARTATAGEAWQMTAFARQRQEECSGASLTRRAVVGGSGGWLGAWRRAWREETQSAMGA
uniref:Uncharacterized protein n=1 Tax=Oryza rufipogon TaxID=4529 RepID=A0A0E0RAY4_ORYRU